MIYGLVVYVIVFFFFFWVLAFRDGCNRKKLAKNKMNWKQEFVLKGIKEVEISFDNTFYNAKDPDMDRYWKKVKKVYVNNQEVRPDKLYKKDDFIYEHCGDYYTVLTKKEIDSIVYKFPPVNRYEEYVKGKLINSTEDFYRKRKLQERLSGSLPTCDE